MLIKNTNLRRIVSLLFVLCLLFCLVPTAAFADYFAEISHSRDKNYSVAVDDEVGINKGYVDTNEGYVNVNEGTVSVNEGTVSVNKGTVSVNESTVSVNEGTVEDNNSGGIVTYNCGGTVKNGNDPVYECFYLEIDTDLIENTVPEKSGVVFWEWSRDREGYDMLWGVQGKPMTMELDIKPGYEPYISRGTGTIKSLGGNKYEISSAGGNIELDVRSTSSVPATADMSNVPLWSALLLVFAATAILTRKKKNG